MVGVPRSGGCHTCRRRRIRCDQQRPHCLRCRSDGKSCEGYERWAVFINRTATGIQKRNKLEEAILPPESNGAQWASDATGSEATGSRRPSPKIPAWTEQHIPPRVPLQSMQYPDKKLLSRFLELYLPVSEVDRNANGSLTWVPLACERTNPSPVLRLSLHALAASRVAHAENDVFLGKESLKCYGDALKLLQKMLSVPTPQADDEVLAACRCLMLFEFFGPAGSSPKAWESHMRGLINFAVLRGPEHFKSTFSAALLNDVKALNMVTCVHDGVVSAFSSPEWRISSTPKTTREAEQRLCDLGLELAAIYGEEDAAQAAGPLTTAKIHCLIAKMDAFTSMFHSELLLFLRLCVPPRTAKYGELNAAAIDAHCMTMILQVSLSVHDYLNRLELDGDLSPPNQPLAPFIKSKGAKWHDQLSLDVVDALEYIISDQMGLYATQGAAYPALMLLNILPHDHTAYARAAKIYHRLITERGLSNRLDYPLPKGQGAGNIGFWSRVDMLEPQAQD